MNARNFLVTSVFLIIVMGFFVIIIHQVNDNDSLSLTGTQQKSYDKIYVMKTGDWFGFPDGFTAKISSISSSGAYFTIYTGTVGNIQTPLMKKGNTYNTFISQNGKRVTLNVSNVYIKNGIYYADIMFKQDLKTTNLLLGELSKTYGANNYVTRDYVVGDTILYSYNEDSSNEKLYIRFDRGQKCTTAPEGYFEIKNEKGTILKAGFFKKGQSYLINSGYYFFNVTNITCDKNTYRFSATVYATRRSRAFTEAKYGKGYYLAIGDSVTYNDEKTSSTVETLIPGDSLILQDNSKLKFVSAIGSTKPEGYFNITVGKKTFITPSLAKGEGYTAAMDNSKVILNVTEITYDTINKKYSAKVTFKSTTKFKVYMKYLEKTEKETKKTIVTGESITITGGAKIYFVSGTGTTTAGYFKITGPNGTSLITPAMKVGDTYETKIDGVNVVVYIKSLEYDAAKSRYSAILRLGNVIRTDKFDYCQIKIGQSACLANDIKQTSIISPNKVTLITDAVEKYDLQFSLINYQTTEKQKEVIKASAGLF